MTRLHVTPAFKLIVLSTLALALTLAFVALTSRPAHGDTEALQTFHIAEIYKIMAGYNGNTNIQAVEIKMLGAGENLVSGVSLVAVDADSTVSTTLGTFAASVPNGAAGGRILLATTAFQTTFGITADLTITPGILTMTGQVSYEKPRRSCPWLERRSSFVGSIRPRSRPARCPRTRSSASSRSRERARAPTRSPTTRAYPSSSPRRWQAWGRRRRRLRWFGSFRTRSAARRRSRLPTGRP